MAASVTQLTPEIRANLLRHLDGHGHIDVFFRTTRSATPAIYWLVIDGDQTAPVAEVVKTAEGWRWMRGAAVVRRPAPAVGRPTGATPNPGFASAAKNR